MSAPPFVLTEDDHALLHLAGKVLRVALARPATTPEQIVALGHTLAALRDLPALPNLHVEINLSTEDEAASWTVHLSPVMLALSVTRSIDSGVGHDHETLYHWQVEVGGFRRAEGDWVYFENALRETATLHIHQEW